MLAQTNISEEQPYLASSKLCVKFWIEGFLDYSDSTFENIFISHATLEQQFVASPTTPGNLVVNFKMNESLNSFCKDVATQVQSQTGTLAKFEHVLNSINAHYTNTSEKIPLLLTKGESAPEEAVCRHKSTLFKAVCDYINAESKKIILPCALVRGFVDGSKNPHRWNLVWCDSLAYVVEFSGKHFTEEILCRERYQRVSCVKEQIVGTTGLSVHAQSGVRIGSKAKIKANVSNVYECTENGKLCYVAAKSLANIAIIDSLPYNSCILRQVDKKAETCYFEYFPGNAKDLCLRLNIYKRLLATATIVCICFCAAKGLRHLHLQNVIHGDICARNIFVSFDGPVLSKVVLGDLETLVKLTDNKHESTYQIGTHHAKETCPIYQQAGAKYRYTRASDVYAFGCTMKELFAAVQLRNRTDFTDFGFASTYDIMDSCMMSTAAARPKMKQVQDCLLRNLTSLYKDMENPKE